jgi:predicted dehydrogenase
MGALWVRDRKPEQTELEYQINNWYHFNWLSGDHICEQHIHNLDVINWLMDGPPADAQGQGGRQVRTGYGQIFDHHFVEFTYPNGTKMLSQCRQIPGCFNSVKEYAHGSKGWCEINAGKIYDRDNKEIWRAPNNEQGHAKEHFDLFASIRKGEIPNEGDYGAISTMTSIMGRMATYSGKLLKWDDCLNSKVSLANTDAMNSFQSEAPLQPENGKYWIPVPGVDTDLVV